MKKFLEQNEYLPDESAFFDTLFTLCNGRIGVRPTIDFDNESSRPGLYIGGVYDFALSVKDQIVNAPNCVDMSIIINGETLNLYYNKILNFSRRLSLYDSILYTDFSILMQNGIAVTVRREEFLDKENNYCRKIGIETDKNAHIRIENCINYSIGNSYHGGYINDMIKSHHVELSNAVWKNNFLQATFLTVLFRKEIAYSCRLECNNVSNRFFALKRIGLATEFDVSARELHSHSYIVSICSEFCTDEYSTLKLKHQKDMETRFANFKQIEFRDDSLTSAMQYSIFQLETIYSDVLDEGTNIPARGLSSGYHHGHFFFNTELYMVPLYTWFNPSFAKSLLMFRFNTLNAAIDTAKGMNRDGAFWSEETGVDGMPAGPVEVIDFIKNERFIENTGKMVQHIGADILYACKYYVNITNDRLFEKNNILPMAIEISKYYASILTENQKSGLFEINGVIGPDEYHIGINNNFYTNYIVKFVLQYASELINKYNFIENDYLCARYSKIIDRIKLPSARDGVIEQFDNFFDLKDFVVSQRKKNGLPIIPDELRDSIFKFGDVEFQIVKQCDIVMLLSLFPKDFTKEILESSFSYYEKRTIHESSLSATHAGIVAGIIGDYLTAFKYIQISSSFNLNFEPRENYNNGLHYAAAAGAWLILLRGILNFDAEDGVLSLKRISPEPFELIKCLNFDFYCGQRQYNIVVKNKQVLVSSKDGLPFEILLENKKINSDGALINIQEEK